MKPFNCFTIQMAYKPNPPNPLPLHVPRGTASWLDEGDIVTLGSKENPAYDQRSGFMIPMDMRFRVVLTDE